MAKNKENEKKVIDAETRQIANENIVMYNERQTQEEDKIDKWITTFAAGSFGLSFTFIGNIVQMNKATHFELLIAAWSCFLMVLVLELVGSLVNSLIHTLLAKEEQKNIDRINKGEDLKYTEWGAFFNPVAVLRYFSFLLFIAGGVLLMLFIAKNILSPFSS